MDCLRSRIYPMASSFRRTVSLLVGAGLVAGCIAFNSSYTDTYYQFDGKTYLVQEFRGNVHNVTLFEVVDGERSFAGQLDLSGAWSMDGLKRSDIPAEEGHLRSIMRVVQLGEKVGAPTTRNQRSIDFEVIKGE